MKQTIKSAGMIAMGLFTLCTIGLSNSTFANAKTGTPAELKYVGKINDQPVFQLSLNNDESGLYFINVKDENNNILYSEKVTGANLTRNYRLAIDDAELNEPGFGVTFEVESATTHKKEVYKVSTQTKVTENIVVAKL
jgi:hypothetical protein